MHLLVHAARDTVALGGCGRDRPHAFLDVVESLMEGARRPGVAAVGADLSGTGAVTFDNTSAVPVPSGSVDLKLVGGNGLIDKFIAMGLLPKDQAMGFRMMLAMFAKPGEGTDTLTSKIEFNKDGSILANGQRIQ
ncbi:hypothetical protein GALL_536590 [mine drainage metagenome]|uniref:Uncharacterized protein n=1 Tax=mine drainage metagenome TaxID=410659 RepID=A0A1J5PHN2_9ZZZZ